MKINSRSSSGSLRRRRKAELKQLLQRHEPERWREWISGAQNPLTTLSAMLFEPDEILCRRAIEAIGVAVAIQAQYDIEPVQRLVTHNFWMMNDESGNVGWYAPETIGEILYSVPKLTDEYAMRLPSFFEEEPFERGAFWAVARVAEIRPDVFDGETIERLTEFTSHPDPVIRYRALLALSRIDPQSATRLAEGLQQDTGKSMEYDYTTGELTVRTIADLARGL